MNNNTYKDVEVKSFAINILKVIVTIFGVVFIISMGVFFDKISKINTGYKTSSIVHSIMLDYQELLLDIERPSIYANFENTAKELTSISIKTFELISLLREDGEITQAEEKSLETAIEKLKEHVKRFNGFLATSGSDFKSFDILYLNTSLIDIKQKILEYVFSTQVDLNDARKYVEHLDQLEKIRIKNLNQINKKIALLNSQNNDDENKKAIYELETEKQNIINEKTFIYLSKKLLINIEDLYNEKQEIKKFSDFEDILLSLKNRITKKIIHQEEVKSQIMLVCIIVLIILTFMVGIVFKYGFDLVYALELLNKAFINTPIQQLLINRKKGKVEYVNNSFTFNEFSPIEQSESLRKAQAFSFYEALDGIVELDDNTKGFEYGTLVQEVHNKIQLYNENDPTNRKETRFFSIYRKDLGNNCELVNKVDVTKKILQIKDYKIKLDNMQKRLDTDTLTGLLTLQALQDRELRDDKVNKNKVFLYLKIDNFNDLRLNYSTWMIDEIIKTFANSLKNALNVKDNDESLEDISIYHLQLDEFCIVYDSQEEAIEAVDLIQRHFRVGTAYEAMLVSNRKNRFELKVGNNIELKDLELNIGISSDRDIIKSNKEVINRLSQAILASYETVITKEPYYVYIEGLSIEKQHAEQQRIANLIRYALDNDRFFIVCQGVHDSKTKEPQYYEALVRLKDENNNIVFPGVFLDIARSVGLYKDIQKVVINKIFDLIEKYPNANFSINLANSDITNKETKDLFLARLNQCSRPEALCVEVLEGESIEKYDVLANFFELISFMGCKIAIDDFGSGYSNFYRLLKIKFDYLKIDGSIIESLVVDKNARIVLETLVSFAHKQGYQVVAEFVKNAEILQIVQEYGIEKVQGYELSRPEEPENIFE